MSLQLLKENIPMKCKPFIPLVVVLLVTLPLVPQIHSQSQYLKTPSDTEGPFYPTDRQADEDNDLVNVRGKSKSAQGDVLYLQGIVLNQKGNPQAGVIIEIWQTDASGLYRHPRERTQGERDPLFQYWGKAQTDTEGNYHFKTLIPGEYEPRPPHIHFKVWVDGKAVLTSQMYIFTDENYRPKVNEQLKLEVVKKSEGDYSGFFQIVI